MKNFSFKSFPDHPLIPDAFRVNVIGFLSRFCDEVSGTTEGRRLWRTYLNLEDHNHQVPFYTVEEHEHENPTQPNCVACQHAGWNHHLVSKRKYHFIIPKDNEWMKPNEDGVLEVQSHILHGLIHCNGFGHLLCINGVEGGSSFICGREVMDLWDRICTTLHTRKVSVVDNSKKKKMDLRLLYGVSYGHTWFGRWDYKFRHGSSGIAKEKYEQALHILSTLTLDDIIDDSKWSSIKNVVTNHRDLTETKIVTVGDFFKWLITLRYDSSQIRGLKRESSPTDTVTEIENCRNWSEVAECMKGKWKVDDLARTASLVVDVLKTKRCETGNGATRTEVRNACLLKMKRKALLDAVLAMMHNVHVDGYIVTRGISPWTGLVGYSIKKMPVIVEPTFDPIFGDDIYKL